MTDQLKTKDGKIVAGIYGRITLKQSEGPGYALLGTVTDEFSADELEAAAGVMIAAAKALRGQADVAKVLLFASPVPLRKLEEAMMSNLATEVPGKEGLWYITSTSFTAGERDDSENGFRAWGVRAA